jgi:hypothetical protein
MNLYNIEQPNGNRAFSGEINKEAKGDVIIYEHWNEELINDKVPEGINLLLFRTVEEFIGVTRTHINAKRKY